MRPKDVINHQIGSLPDSTNNSDGPPAAASTDADMTYDPRSNSEGTNVPSSTSDATVMSNEGEEGMTNDPLNCIFEGSIVTSLRGDGSLTSLLSTHTLTTITQEGTSSNPQSTTNNAVTETSVTASTLDPCLSATSATYPISYDVVKSCLDSDFPFPSDNRAQTAATIKTLINSSYVFQDLAANPPDIQGFELQTAAITQDIDNLLKSPSLTPREFHEGISDALDRARDAHLSYSANCFTDAFTFDNGLFFGDFVQDGEKKIIVLAELPSFGSLSSLQFSPTGCEVVTINGQPANDYIQAWADQHLSISKNANVR